MFNTKFIQIAGWSVLCLTVSFAGCSEKAGIPSGYDIPAEAAVQIEALSVADTDCGFDFIWSFDDRVSVAAGAGEPVSARVYPYSDYQTAIIRPEFGEEVSFPVVFRAVYPASAFVSRTSSEDVMNVRFPETQASLSDGPDRNSVIMYGKSSGVREDEEKAGIGFSMASVFAKISFEGIPEDDAARSVQITSEKIPLAGNAALDMSDGTVAMASDAAGAIEVSLPDDYDGSLWVGMAPVESLADAALECNVTTASGDVYSGILSADEASSVMAGHFAELSAALELQPKEAPQADILDVEFTSDGNARDKSASSLPVQTVYGSFMATRHSDLFGADIARFNHDFNVQPDAYGVGGLQTSGAYGFFRTDLSGVSDRIETAHTIECVFSTDYVPADKDIVIAGSLSGDGFGIIIRDGTIRYCLGNTVIDSGISPAAGQYYHVVGTYNSVTGRAAVYVDGKQVIISEAEALSSPVGLFGIGSGPKDIKEGDNGMRGNVAVVRLYGKNLSRSEIAGLYEASKVANYDNTGFFTVADVRFAQSLAVNDGSDFFINGKNFESGDKVAFESVTTGTSYESNTAYVSTTSLNAKVPDGIPDGKYRILLTRGSRTVALGTVQFATGLTLYPQSDITAVSTNSFANGEPIANTLDNNRGTQWQANWGTATEDNIKHTPDDGRYYELVYSMAESQTLAAVDIVENFDTRGRADLKDIIVSVSDDGQQWTEAGTFIQFHGVHMYGSGSEYRISFILPAPVQARYVRISLGDSWRYSGEYCCANVRELNFYVK